MKTKLFIVYFILFFSYPVMSFVGEGHVTGKITNITSTNVGILVRIGANEVPLNCTSGRKWMEIRQEKSAMIAMTITAWTLGRGVSVYTSAATSGYCQIGQVDPAEQ